MIWSQTGSGNRDGVFEAVLDYFEHVFTNIKNMIRFLPRREEFATILSSRTLCCKSEKQWSVEEHLVSFVMDSGKYNTLVVILPISQL